MFQFFKAKNLYSRVCTSHSKKFFWTLCGGEEEGILAFFWPKFTKNVTGEGEGRGQNLKKRAKFTFFVNLFFKEFLHIILSK
jgi:hypothetical protein